MNKCSYCGKESRETAEFCPGCGTPFQVDDGWEPLVDAEASNWIVRAFGWALEQFGPDNFYQNTVLVTPTKDFFHVSLDGSQQLAGEVFARVRTYAGMQDWPCKLIAQAPDMNPELAPLVYLENAPRGPGGTFCRPHEDAEVEITYNPSLIKRPQALVAVLAHELAHYLGHTTSTPPPGGEKNWEYATDLLAVFMGFGIFLANSAFRFQQFTGVGTQGWSSGKLGYLTDFEVVYCLALFCVLKGIPREQVQPHLKPSLLPVFGNCVQDLRRKSSRVAELRRVNNAANQTQ